MARDISRHILHLKIEDNMELVDKEFTRIEKRDADLVFKNGEQIVHIEIQNNNHLQMHQRMLRYLSDILFEFEALEIKQYLLYIGQKPCNMKNSIRKQDLDYKYDIIDMRNIPCEALLQSNDPSAVALSILCDFKGKDKQTVVNTILLRLKELSNESEYPNFLKILNVYSTNRNLENEVEKGVQMLTVDIEKTPFYKIGERKGIEKGIKDGIQQGIEKGIEKGAIMMVKQMLKFGLDKEAIFKITNLSIEKINEIQKELV
jgi:predicted transposase/invertase (TIGR01784 family)